MTASGAQARVVRRPDVTLTRTGDEALLVDQANGKVHVVNRSAARLWELCEPGPTIDELVAAMAGAYSVDETAIRGDVVTTVATFRDLGLLEPS